MNKIWVGVGAAILAGGAAGGYWHFARMLPEREQAAPVATAPDGPETPEAPEPEPVTPAPEPAAPAAEAPRTPTEEIAAASPPSDEPAGPDVASPTAEPDATAEIPSSTGEPVQQPGLELLRVEPDGSAVFAGRVAPGSRVEILRGDEVLASETADASGDFVATLDEPLPVGDHELTLRATGPDGTTVQIPQVAIVSVPPAGREGELLVALGTPDEPTQLIQTPEPAAAPQAPDEATSAAAPPSDAAAGPTPPTSVEAAPLRGSEGGDLAIGAVEIEGDRMYVAGTSRPGTTIRIYLDDEFVAEADGTGDQFIAEAIANVGVGSHVVRADEIGPDGRVVARVEVPFERPEGESMAALAPGFGRSAESGPDTPSESVPASEPQDEPTSSPMPATTPDVPATPPAPVEIAQAPTPAPMTPPAATSRPTENTGSAATSPAPASPSAPSPSGTSDQATTPSPEPSNNPAETAAQPAETPGAAAPVTASPEPSAPTVASPSPEPAATGRNEPPSSSTPVASAPDVEPLQTATRQAALEPVEGRVIIRRGDTLWRISRETYGLGRRYTTIYLANGDQIRDPDLIYPGQIFRLPGEAVR